MAHENSRTIRVKDETWSRLNACKSPGESFDSVIRRSLAKSNIEDEEDRLHTASR
jgi:predicted CopG family antitoxin